MVEQEPAVIYCETMDPIPSGPPDLPPRKRDVFSIPPGPPDLPPRNRDVFPRFRFQENPTVVSQSHNRCCQNTFSTKKVALIMAVVLFATLSIAFIVIHFTADNENRNSTIEKKNVTSIATPKPKSKVFKSCKALLDIYSEAKDGVYKIKTDTTSGYTKVYCQMTSLRGCTGRGWTMVMKIDGSKDTFVYSSNYWSTNQSYNPSGGLTAFDDQETKLATYHSTSFKELCVGMKVANNLKFVSISYTASSLYSLIADDITRSTNLSRQKWKSLIVNSSLQQNCNKQGFNIKPGSNEAVYVRIGIIANNEWDCYNPDSFLGFGGRPFTYHWCLFEPSLNSCGNVAGCNADNGNADINAMGYIFIR